MANDKDFVVNGPVVVGKDIKITVGSTTSGSVGYSLANGTFDQKSFDASAQDTSALGLFIKPDGTKFYQVGSDNDTVFQYSMSTAWDISTASYDSVSFSVAGQDATPYGVFFKPDGLTMYVLGRVSGAIYQYTLSTAWDVSTASYASKSFFTTGQVALPVTGLFFSSDGTSCYVMDSSASSSDIYQYTLSTAWDVSTASYASKTFAIDDGSVASLFFSADGTKVFYNNYSDDRVEELSLSTAWDISTASKTGVTLDVSAESTTNWNLFFKTDGSKLYINNTTGGNNTIYQYSTTSLTQTLDLSTGNYFNPTLTENTKFILSNAGDVQAFQLEVTGVAFGTPRLASATFINKTFSTATEVVNPDGLFFKVDGSAMYVLADGSSTVFQYTLSTAWDVSTASYTSKSFSYSSQTTAASGMFFKPDGTKMYVIRNSAADFIHQYTLSTAWDVSTASYDNKSLDIAVQDTAPQGVAFKPSGDRMFLLGNSGDDITEYSLSTAWDVSTASYVQAKSISTLSTAPNAFAFSSDGTFVFVADGNDDAIHSFSLGTAWSLSTLTPVDSFTSVAEFYNVRMGFALGGDDYFYHLAALDNLIYQYAFNRSAVITWPTSIKWPNGAAPSAPDNGETDVFTFTTDDGGTTYTGVKSIDNAS